MEYNTVVAVVYMQLVSVFGRRVSPRRPLSVDASLGVSTHSLLFAEKINPQKNRPGGRAIIVPCVLQHTCTVYNTRYIVPGTSIRSRSAMLPTGQLGNGFTSSERERKQRGRGYAREERGKGGPFRSSTLAVVGRMRKAHPTRYTKYDRHFGPPFSFFVRGIYPKKLFRLVGDPWPCIFGVVVS